MAKEQKSERAQSASTILVSQIKDLKKTKKKFEYAIEVLTDLKPKPNTPIALAIAAITEQKAQLNKIAAQLAEKLMDAE